MAIQAQFYSENPGFPLGGSQDWIDSACDFNHFHFDLPPNPQKYQIPQQRQQQFVNPHQQSAFLLPENINNGCYQSMGLSAQLEQQRQEIDRFICLQNQRLILALEEQRKQQLGLLLRKYETKTQFLLKQKDEEIAKGVQRRMELEDFMRRVEYENQRWQRVANENEAMTLHLNNQIEQLNNENACLANVGFVEDSESCCDVATNRGGTEGEEEQTGGDHNKQEQRKMNCKSCGCRSSCVVFLPCRHLCSCKACEAFLGSCPVCGTSKKASIEALL